MDVNEIHEKKSPERITTPSTKKVATPSVRIKLEDRTETPVKSVEKKPKLDRKTHLKEPINIEAALLEISDEDFET